MSAAFPLSSGQKSLWFMQQILPESAVYHIALAVRILSPVDVSTLHSVLQTIADRHDSLRTVFATDAKGELIQTVCACGPVAFGLIATTGLSADEIDARVTAAYRHPFDLEAGPLFRSHLFTNAADSHLLLITASPPWFSTRCRWSASLPSSWNCIAPRSPVERLHSFLSKPDTAISWSGKVRCSLGPRERLTQRSGVSSWKALHLVLDFPTDRPRPMHPRGRGGSLWFPIEEKLVQDLESACRRSPGPSVRHLRELPGRFFCIVTAARPMFWSALSPAAGRTYDTDEPRDRSATRSFCAHASMETRHSPISCGVSRKGLSRAWLIRTIRFRWWWRSCTRSAYPATCR